MRMQKEYRKILKIFIHYPLPKILYQQGEILLCLNSELAGVAQSLLRRKKPKKIPNVWIEQTEIDLMNLICKNLTGSEKKEFQLYCSLVFTVISIFDYSLESTGKGKTGDG